MKDIFICHASEDKPTVVRPLVEALENSNISCWLDETEIQWGDSITQRVNNGLSRARFVIVVLSKAFLSKHWPQRELNAVLNLEASTGQVKVLPIVYGDRQAVKDILSELPLLNDKIYLSWDGNPSSIVSALLVRLGRSSTITDTSDISDQPKFNLPLPKAKKDFTDYDRNKFIKDGFRMIRDYFSEALTQLRSHYPHIQSELEDIHAQKFISRLYADGKLINECNIRIGGLGSSNSIGYSEGRFVLHNDNSYNEILSIEDNRSDLFFTCSFGMYSGYTDKKLLAPIEAAELLWKRFIDPLNS